MLRTTVLLLAFVSSALGYAVISPNTKSGWTNQGAQLLTWERVRTDSPTFSVVLENQDLDGFNPIILATKVDGTLLKKNLNPPSDGWPTGSNFRVNFVADNGNFNTIYAQSKYFDIVNKGPTSTTSTTTTTTKPTDKPTDKPNDKPNDGKPNDNKPNDNKPNDGKPNNSNPNDGKPNNSGLPDKASGPHNSTLNKAL
ncbi:hypothetical protein BDN70DRAFT_68282 [Pholiota conissans]|uniref:Uncharacterized protein n=1 Tax=Pholiota conissans TaxID=109636 RepID=A0A9P6CZW7_9AGAR|nr:hypothetical protein BDN70DRAFT_68282 [Pholiota conissans]